MAMDYSMLNDITGIPIAIANHRSDCPIYTKSNNPESSNHFYRDGHSLSGIQRKEQISALLASETQHSITKMPLCAPCINELRNQSQDLLRNTHIHLQKQQEYYEKLLSQKDVSINGDIAVDQLGEEDVGSLRREIEHLKSIFYGNNDRIHQGLVKLRGADNDLEKEITDFKAENIASKEFMNDDLDALLYDTAFLLKCIYQEEKQLNRLCCLDVSRQESDVTYIQSTLIPLYDNMKFLEYISDSGDSIHFCIINGIRVSYRTIPHIQVNWHEINVGLSCSVGLLCSMRNMCDLKSNISMNAKEVCPNIYNIYRTHISHDDDCLSRGTMVVTPISLTDRSVFSIQNAETEAAYNLILEGGIEGDGTQFDAALLVLVYCILMTKFEMEERRCLGKFNDEIDTVLYFSDMLKSGDLYEMGLILLKGGDILNNAFRNNHAVNKTQEMEKLLMDALKMIMDMAK